MRNKLFWFVLFCLTLGEVSAQDIHFSQFYASPLQNNPALTGTYNGDIRLILNNRNQWSSVTVPYKTTAASAELKITGKRLGNDFLGIGMSLFSDKAGDSELSLFNLGLSICYMKKIGRMKGHYAGLGFQTGAVQGSINFANLRFDNQYNGDRFDPTLYNGEVFNNSKYAYFDHTIGAYWSLAPKRRTKYQLGLSVAHLTRPFHTFMKNSLARLPMKFILSSYNTISLNPKLDLLPGFNVMFQNTFTEVMVGTSLRFVMEAKRHYLNAFYVGTWMRTQDAIVWVVGIEYLGANLGISYDYNFSDLVPASNGRGGLELSLIYVLQKPKPSTKSGTSCPVYF